ncbi:sperm-associated antigen 8 isoform X1 [Oreochromis niloticus]|uniref:sperm-associated antigen 8 isoform X1 n=1 Tax=Oreochromis niloticus TaxID=8128 RepID=UPI000DF14515|nr:uncharacterized protein LOC100708955 isoform X1 [Oreochromis niloticus]
MTEQTAAAGHKVGKPMSHNWVEEIFMVFQRLKNPVIDHSESQDGVCDYAESSLCCSKESSGEVTGHQRRAAEKTHCPDDKRCPDLPLAPPPPLANLGEAKAFPSQPRDIVSPQHVLVLPRGFTNLSEETPRKHRCPNHFSWLLSSEKIRADLNPQTPKTEYCSTTQKDFCVEGFVPFKPETTRIHDYKTDQAITFWSENCQRIQGVTAARSLKGPFRKSALFSTPITERLDEIDLPPDN